MMMAMLSHLHELYLAPKVIHHRLEPPGLPPLDRHVVLPARDDNPERDLTFCHLVDLRVPRLLQLRNVNIAPELSRLNRQSKPAIQEFYVPVQAVVRRLIATVDQRIAAFDRLSPFCFLLQPRDEWIVLPYFREERLHIRLELARVAPVQVPDRRRQHHDVSRRKVTFENQPSHQDTKSLSTVCRDEL